MADAERMIDRLAGYLNEPYREQEVLEAARTLMPPFLLREIVAATGLPRMVVHTRLTRLVRKGVLTRCKANMTVKGMIGPNRQGFFTKPIYLYSFADAE